MGYRPPGYRIPNQPYSRRYGSNLYLPANVGPMRGMLDAGPGGSVLRQSAKRCYTNISVASNPGDFYNVRMYNTFYETVDTIQVGFPHWCDGNPETSCTGTQTVRAYFQWAGNPTVYPLTFNGGAPSGSISAGNVVTDDLTLHTDLCSIPRGSGSFFLNYYMTSTTGQLPYSVQNNNGAASVANGDAIAIGANIAQFGAFADAGIANTFFLWPSYIASVLSGKNKVPAIIGDSRCSTEGGLVINATGDVGEVPKALGKFTQYLNVARAGQTSTGYTASNAQRSRLIKRFADYIIYDLSINDFPGFTGAQTYAQALINSQLYPGMPFFPTTISPNTTTTDAWATLANQTVTAKEAGRLAYNALVRGNSNNFKGFYDICQYTESSLNSGKWPVTGAANYPTNDGLHGSGALNINVVIPPFTG